LHARWRKKGVVREAVDVLGVGMGDAFGEVFGEAVGERRGEGRGKSWSSSSSGMGDLREEVAHVDMDAEVEEVEEVDAS
jgi:hypothetical protein